MGLIEDNIETDSFGKTGTFALDHTKFADSPTPGTGGVKQISIMEFEGALQPGNSDIKQRLIEELDIIDGQRLAVDLTLAEYGCVLEETDEITLLGVLWRNGCFKTDGPGDCESSGLFCAGSSDTINQFN